MISGTKILQYIVNDLNIYHNSSDITHKNKLYTVCTYNISLKPTTALENGGFIFLVEKKCKQQI
jgi:hypothetical protein